MLESIHHAKHSIPSTDTRIQASIQRGLIVASNLMTANPKCRQHFLRATNPLTQNAAYGSIIFFARSYSHTPQHTAATLYLIIVFVYRVGVMCFLSFNV